MTQRRSDSFQAPSFGARFLLVIACAAIGGTALPARADVVTAWNEKAMGLLPKMGKQGTFNLRGLTMMYAAMFDAVNAVERRYSPINVDATAPKGASSTAAAAAAARRVLAELVPQEREAIDALYRTTLATIPQGRARSDGEALGEDVAAKILLWRSADRSDKLVEYVGRGGPGFYVATSSNPMIAPHWGRVVPWTMTSGDEFRPGPPPSLDEEEWRRDLTETRTLGCKSCAQRTAEETVIATFHSPPEFPVWNAIARIAVAGKRPDLAASARLFALMNLAMADAHIAVYDAKYTYQFWRPVTAVHAGSTGIAADADWQPFIQTPMHPEYPCAHCTLGGAARAVLESEFGADLPFSVTTQALPETIRSYAGFAAFAEEEAYSRILGGIHFRHSLTTGAALGRKIGEHAVATLMQPASSTTSRSSPSVQRAVPASQVRVEPAPR